jgi:hypothetical protein
MVSLGSPSKPLSPLLDDKKSSISPDILVDSDESDSEEEHELDVLRKFVGEVLDLS